MPSPQPPRKVQYHESKARRIWGFRMPEPVYNRVCSICPPEGARSAYWQIFAGTTRADKVEDLIDGCHVRVPVPCTVWSQFPLPATETWMVLRDLGLVEVADYNVGRSCRTFALPPDQVLELQRLALTSMEAPWVDVFTGRVVRPREIREPKRKQKGGKRGRPTRTCRVEMAFADACREALRLLDLAERNGSAHWRAHAISAVSGLSAIRSSSSFHWSRSKPGRASYIPTYEYGDNGRAYEIGGGIQCLPRSVKQALLLYPGSPLRNLDLRRCHLAAYSAVSSVLNGWRWKVEQRGGEPTFPYIAGMEEKTEVLDTPKGMRRAKLFGIRDLVKDAEPFKTLGKRTDLPEDVVKAIIYGAINGGSLRGQHWKTKDGTVECGEILKLLKKHTGSLGEAVAALRRLRPELVLVERSCDSFAKTLMAIVSNRWSLRGAPAAVLRIMRIVGRHGEVYLENAAGGELRVTDADAMPRKDLAGLARRAASHILCGVEQECMGTFRELCDAAGIAVVALEHDGAVVSQELPAWFESELKSKTLLAEYAQLRLKPFYPPEERHELDLLCESVLRTAHSARVVEIAPRESFKARIEREDTEMSDVSENDDEPTYLADRLARIGQPRPAPEPGPELPREPYCPPDWEVAMAESMAAAVEQALREREEREKRREAARAREAEFQEKFARERIENEKRRAREAERAKRDPANLQMRYADVVDLEIATGNPASREELLGSQDPDQMVSRPYARRYGESRSAADLRWHAEKDLETDDTPEARAWTVARLARMEASRIENANEMRARVGAPPLPVPPAPTQQELNALRDAWFEADNVRLGIA